MCIIAMKPEGIILSEGKLRHMWTNNPDGAGFMYAEDGKLHIVKGMMTFASFMSAYNEVGPKRKMVLHFRIRTHGAIKPEMTHPFWINSELGMVHNGTIVKVANETTALRSDTAVFAQKLANEYSDPLTAIQNPFHKAMIESFIGYSKLVFMDSTGETYIFNESMGNWEKGVWFSNNGHKPAKTSAKNPQKHNPTEEALSRWTQPTHGVTSGKSGNETVKMKNAPEIRMEMRNGKMTEVKVYPMYDSKTRH